MNDNKKFWQRMAKFYSFYMRGSDAAFAQLNQLLKPYLSAEMTVLEIGCGTGQLSFLVAQSVKKLIASDFSARMIAECNKKNTASNIVFQVEDGTALSFADDSFDAVVIANVLHIVPQPDAVISEIKRVLKPTGIVFAPIFVSRSSESRLKLWLLGRLGFKVYNKFDAAQYQLFLKEQELEIVQCTMVASNPADECVVIARITT